MKKRDTVTRAVVRDFDPKLVNVEVTWPMGRVKTEQVAASSARPGNYRTDGQWRRVMRGSGLTRWSRFFCS